MVDFNIKEGIDTLSSVNNIIPTGSLIMKAFSPSVLLNYDTDDKCLAAGFVPCDGRFLQAYKFKKLHSVINNVYGGISYQENLPIKVQKTATSSTSRTNLGGNRYVKLFLDNSDGAIKINDTLIVPGFYEERYQSQGNTTVGAEITEVSSSFVEFWDRGLLFFSPTFPIIISTLSGFGVPDLRTSRRYIYGQSTVSGGVYTPSFSGNTTNAVTHSHSFSGNFGGNLSTNATAGTHTHSTSYTFSDGGSDYHSHYYIANAGGLSTSGPLTGTLTKTDGTGTAAGAAHTHSTGGVGLSFPTGNGGASHSHSGSGTSDAHTEPTHTHTFSATPSVPASSPIDIPYINVLYFIKL
jgi:hypothetical protein